MGNRFSAVILAAGESARLGYDKLSLPLGTETILEHTIAKFLIDSVDEIIIVTGRFIPECRSSITSPKVQWLHNPDYTLGMSSSVKKGIRRLGGSSDAVFITPADIPLFRAATVQMMIAAFTPSKIIIPAYKGKKGHPVLLDIDLARQCLRTQSDKVLYDVIKKNQNAVELLPVKDAGIAMDIDTAEDYEELKKYYAKLLH